MALVTLGLTHDGVTPARIKHATETTIPVHGVE